VFHIDYRLKFADFSDDYIIPVRFCRKMLFAIRSARLLSSRAVRLTQTRGYADEMAFTLAAANKVFYDRANVKQIDVPSFSGSFGILPKHVPTLGKSSLCIRPHE
jgi:hypothetical protein